jgi:hypothetical protein
MMMNACMMMKLYLPHGGAAWNLEKPGGDDDLGGSGPGCLGSVGTTRGLATAFFAVSALSGIAFSFEVPSPPFSVP